MGIFRKLFGNRQATQKEIPQNDKRDDAAFATESSRQMLGEALCNAAEAGDVNEVKRLLSQGTEPHYQTGPKRANPLLLAAIKGHAKAVRLLIEAGAYVNEANTDGLTPLIAASMNNHIEVVRVLCDNNADPNLQLVKDKYTALMFAESKEVFKILLDRGANTALRNKWGDTVLELAQARKNNEFIRLLESSKKADVDSSTDQKVRHIKEIQSRLFGHGDRFETTFDALFSYLKDKDSEIKSLASLYLAMSPEAVERLISIYRTSISTDPATAVQAGRAIGRKFSGGKPDMISAETTAMIYGIRLAFIPYSCSFCGKPNIGIPVSTEWLIFYGRKDSKGVNNALPVLCDFCNKEFFLCWD